MNTNLQISNTIAGNDHLVIIAGEKTNWKKSEWLSPDDIQLIRSHLEKEITTIIIHQPGRTAFVAVVEKKEAEYKTAEEYRKAGNNVVSLVNKQKIETVTLINLSGNNQHTLSFAEGMLLGNYQFLRYKKDALREANSLKTIFIQKNSATAKEIEFLSIGAEATCIARDLVNEYPANQTSVMLSEEIKKLGKAAGFRVEVLNKSQLEKLGMGGLLAVNRGSKNPPTFSILEWKPQRAVNKKPYVLVGKGIVFDTGGLSLKPTANSMDHMKCDMAGAAAIASTLYAIAKAKMPVHVIGLVPSTDNRPGENAYVPGDVVRMHNGMTVEVLNTDAEGRMILADALSYAQQYQPELVIDMATLTGAVVVALGSHAIGMMSTADERTKSNLKKSSEAIYERVVEFPLWEEYEEHIKSDIADLKNIGSPGQAGTIIGGTFLKNFINYPWIHLDIAGTAFLHKTDSYRGKNATGVGVRLLFDFFRNVAGKKK